jgi:RNA polymerase sigma factor (sigma-70 family)
VVSEVLLVARGGSLVLRSSESVQAYVFFWRAEENLDWSFERVGQRAALIRVAPEAFKRTLQNKLENCAFVVHLGMSPVGEYNSALAPTGKDFNTTHWSVVLAARGESADARAALEKLCRLYWYPLYAFVRRQGHSPEDVEDLIQGFFARLLERKDLETVQRERGRFRSYLLVSLKHFLINEQYRARTEKRGGGQALIPLDEVQAEKKFALEPVDKSTPEKIFERRWALALLDKVLEQLRKEYETTDRLGLFESLRWFLSDEPAEQSQAQIGAKLGLSPGAVKQAVRRLRLRYRELLREEVAHTVATAADIDDEVRHLVAVLRGT